MLGRGTGQTPVSIYEKNYRPPNLERSTALKRGMSENLVESSWTLLESTDESHCPPFSDAQLPTFGIITTIIFPDRRRRFFFLLTSPHVPCLSGVFHSFTPVYNSALYLFHTSNHQMPHFCNFSFPHFLACACVIDGSHITLPSQTWAGTGGIYLTWCYPSYPSLCIGIDFTCHLFLMLVPASTWALYSSSNQKIWQGVQRSSSSRQWGITQCWR